MSFKDIPHILLGAMLFAVFIILMSPTWVPLFLLALGIYVYYSFFSNERKMGENELHSTMLGFFFRVCLAVGQFWFDYSVDGLDKLPDNGPALILCYHGPIPIDHLFLVSKILAAKKRIVHSVVDKLFGRVSLFRPFLKIGNCMAGTRESCRDLLERGEILVISPGGLFEAQFSRPTYDLLWNNKIGFAHLISDTGCPVYLAFTSGIQETFRSISPLSNALNKKLFKITRLPVVPVIGPFPVGLKTHIVGPLDFRDNCTSVEDFKAICMAEMRSLIVEKQRRIPGSVMGALWQRVTTAFQYYFQH